MNNQRQVFLTGTAINLVLLIKEDSPVMVQWLNNQEINQFLSMGSQPLTIEQEDIFVENAYKNDARIVFGIWHKKDQKLIGNTGLHSINQLHQTASFGIVVGDKDYWSKGVGTEVLNLMLSYAFTIRNLRNVTLSVPGNNPRGKRCYEKCGFVNMGTYAKHVYKAGEWHDEHLMIAHNPTNN